METGCSKCKLLEEHARLAIAELGNGAEVEKVTDMETIVNMGVMSTPALAVDGSGQKRRPHSYEGPGRGYPERSQMMPCSCGGECETILIYSCAGAANTGLLADQVARALYRDKTGVMTCLAAVGAEMSGFVESARNATRNIVIDGCPIGCGKKIFEARGLPHEHYITTDFDVVKGKTPITGDVIERVAGTTRDKISTPPPTNLKDRGQ